MPIAEITRAETEARARLLRVRSYDVGLDLTGDGDTFRSVTVIRFDCTEPGAASHADLVAAAVHQITLNGVALDPGHAWDGGRIALAGLAASNELRVAADCAYSSTGTGMHRSVDSADGRVYTYAKFEPAYARTVYAAFEQPDLKAPVTFHVTAPAHWTVLSNQPAPVPEPAGTGRAVWHFPPTPPLPTYVTTVVAGDYHVVTGEHTTPAGQRIPLELACRSSLAAHLDATAIFQVTRQGLDHYCGLLATRYPFAKYGQVLVPEFSAGATEDAGCVLLSERFLFRDRATSAMHETRAMVILHEMAHMWFGDLVTMRWWDDLWLNESFAEFCGYQATAEATRFTGAWTTFAAGRKPWGIEADRLPSTHPVAADAPTLSQALANFDGISYAKGACVVRQLAASVGAAAFTAALRDYLATHAWGNAALADFLAAVEARSGASLAGWSQAWLKTAGLNTLRPEFTAGGSGELTSFAVRQEACAAHPVLRPHQVSVGLYRRGAGGLELARRVRASLGGPLTQVPQLRGEPRPDLVVINDDDLDYAAVRFDAASLRTLTGPGADVADPLARVVCWTAAMDMAWQAELPVPAVVAMLAAGIAGEPSVAVRQAVATRAGLLLARLADPAWVPEGRRALAETATRMLRAAEPASDSQLAWAELLAATAASPGQLSLAAGLLDGTAAVPGLTVTTGLRWSLLRRLAATGRLGDGAVDAELAADRSDAGQRAAAACRAAVPDAAHKEAAWRLLTAGEAGPETLRSVGAAFADPEHAALLAPYATRYLPALAETWESGGGHLRILLGDLLFPYPAVSPSLLAEIDAYLAAAPRDPGLARMLADRRDLGERALRSRALRG